MNATETGKTCKKIEKVAVFAKTRAADFPGSDGIPPVVERSAAGLTIIYRDEETMATVTIRFKGGRTATKVSVPRLLKCYEAARLAAMLKVASDFAVNLDFQGGQ